MIEITSASTEMSWNERGRQLLDAGNIAEAIECYKQSSDPDSLDEREARDMLIEARAHLSRKYFTEALECFEEALIMGTDIQRSQALEGIRTVAEARMKLPRLTATLMKGLRERFGKRGSAAYGLALASEDDNIILLTEDAIEALPEHLKRGSRIGKLPPRLSDITFPISAQRGVAYANMDDVQYILDIARALKERGNIHREHTGHPVNSVGTSR
jgi:tetratricopeptide (TPR) repeat protein|uniref:Tetratricopeptide repeat protein n=1 Tax=Desulfomonile tiedjei TaxID=2358 RepID=A0A7C4AQ51_9BACT